VKDVEVTVVQLAQERVEGCCLGPVDLDPTPAAQRPQRRLEALALPFDVEPGEVDDVADHGEHAQRRADGERGPGSRDVEITDHGRPRRDRQEVRFVVEVLPRDIHELGHLGERERHAQAPVLPPCIGQARAVDVAHLALEEGCEKLAPELLGAVRVRRLHASGSPPPTHAQHEVLDVEPLEGQIEVPVTLALLALDGHRVALRPRAGLDADDQPVVLKHAIASLAVPVDCEPEVGLAASLVMFRWRVGMVTS
jgi:hypothetical protein